MLHARAPKGKTATSYSTLMLLQALSGLSETGETLLFKQKNKHSFSIRHSLMCSVMGQLSFKIEHKLKCSTELDLSSKCSHVQPYVFLESFFKTYHNKMDCERFFFNSWKRTTEKLSLSHTVYYKPSQKHDAISQAILLYWSSWLQCKLTLCSLPVTFYL